MRYLYTTERKEFADKLRYYTRLTRYDIYRSKRKEFEHFKIAASDILVNFSKTDNFYIQSILDRLYAITTYKSNR